MISLKECKELAKKNKDGFYIPRDIEVVRLFGYKDSGSLNYMKKYHKRRYEVVKLGAFMMLNGLSMEKVIAMVKKIDKIKEFCNES